MLHFTINVLLQIEVLENKLKTKINELEEITLKKLEVEEKLEDVEKLSTKEKEALNLKLKTLEKNLVVVTEVKEQLEVKLEQVSLKWCRCGLSIVRVPTRPRKPGKMRVHLENLEISWNFENFNMSHFAYACKMRYPLNLVLESWEYLWFY